jgi:hypothetical protein
MVIAAPGHLLRATPIRHSQSISLTDCHGKGEEHRAGRRLRSTVVRSSRTFLPVLNPRKGGGEMKKTIVVAVISYDDHGGLMR